jgi:hypothetical protein
MVDHTVLLERAHRAGEVAQALFYIFIEHTWAYDMSRMCVISDQHDELVTVEVIHDSNHVTNPEGKNVYKQQAGGGLTKFPQEAFKSTDRFAKRSLLADRHSIWAFVFMHAAVLPPFEGMQSRMICPTLAKIAFRPGQRRRARHQGGCTLSTGKYATYCPASRPVRF